MKARERAGQIIALAASIILMLMVASLALLGHRYRRTRNERLQALVGAIDRQTEQVERVAETFTDLAKMD